MSSTVTDVAWGTSGSSKDFKDAFDGFLELTGRATDKVLIPSDDGKPSEEKKQFIINSQGYHDVKAYVYIGIKLPSSDESFSKYFVAESAVKKLTDLDPLIYTTTRKTVFDIQEHCKNFEKEMATITTVAENVLQYALSALDMLSYDTELSLREKFDLINDERYKNGDPDEDYEAAIQIVQSQLESMKELAHEKQGKIEKMRQNIEMFRNQTRDDKRQVNFLHQLFWDGPVVNIKTNEPISVDGNQIKNYSEYLDAEYTRLTKDAMNKIEEKEKELRNQRTGVALGLLLVPVNLGLLIALPAMVAAIPEINDAIEKIKTRKTDIKLEADQVQTLISSVKVLNNQIDKLVDAIEKALVALDELVLLFREQAIYLGKASNSCRQALKGLPKDKKWATRKIFLNAFVKNGTNVWKEVERLVNQFLETTQMEPEVA